VKGIDDMLCALIMAGGKGTRFWPASTEEKPKQFLNLFGDKTMLQTTVDRLLGILPIERIFICTGEKYKELCLKQLPNLPEKNIIIEPIGRNTAPCIMLSAVYIHQIYKNSSIAVLPSDHAINEPEKFLEIISNASEFVENKERGIVTIGIKPDRPEIGYGYIKYSDQLEEIKNSSIYKVDKFVEKPNLEKAKSYLNDGGYLLNAGMFIFNPQYIFEQFKLYSNETYNALIDLPNHLSDDYMKVLEERYKLCEAIYVDYAIMENCKEIYVIPSEFGWDDVGSWLALERYLNKDNRGNITKGDIEIFNSYNNTIYSDNQNIILLDVEGLFCIEVEDKIIIGKKESLTKVHELRGK